MIFETYLDISECTEYCQTRLDDSVWDSVDTDKQQRSLHEATRRIDRFAYKGSKADPNQSLQFPRDTDTVVPDDIKIACAELALALLDGFDPEMEIEKLNKTSTAYGRFVQNQYERGANPEHLRHGLPYKVWEYLKPYFRDTDEIQLSRVD